MSPDTRDPGKPPSPPESTAARALAVAGDAEQARDVGALDDAARAARQRLARRKRGLVERLIYGPAPSHDELAAAGRSVPERSERVQAVVDVALARMAAGEAFTADGRLSQELRRAVAGEAAYGFTVPVEFGGKGASYRELAVLEERLAAAGLGPLAVEISGQLTIGAGSLLGYGSTEQKRLFLPMLAEGRLMGFALTEVGVGVNAKKVQAFVERDEERGCWRLFAEGPHAKLYITNAAYGALVGLVARLGRGGDRVGLFVVELPERDVAAGEGVDWSFSCEPSGATAFASNYNSKLTFHNFPIPDDHRIDADGVEVLFYCLRMGRCMLSSMSAGYQRMLAADAVRYAVSRDGVGGKVIRHELPRLAIGRILGGALQSRALAHLSLQQDADGVDLAGLRDLTKSAAATSALESLHACEHVVGGRSFDKGSRIAQARDNLHVFGIVEGEDDLILLGMVKDVTSRFVDRYLADLLSVIQSVNRKPTGEPIPAAQRILRIGPREALRHPRRCLKATLRLLRQHGFWRLCGWIVREAALDLARLPGRLVPSGWIPRYRRLPRRLRRHARFAERELRRQRWVYLGINLYYQLELTRAQIPLQRFGKAIEHLVAMLAVVHHAAPQDLSQHRVADLQARLLRNRYRGIRILRDLRGIEHTRALLERIADDVELDNATLLRGIPPATLAHPWR